MPNSPHESISLPAQSPDRTRTLVEFRVGRTIAAGQIERVKDIMA